jgi:hypothetical protein
MDQAISASPSLSQSPASLGGVNLILRAEALSGLAVVAFYAWFGFSWGLFALLFLVPDLAMATYALGPKWGAAAYNVAHATIAPLALGAAALGLRAPLGEAVALIWLAHIEFDRVLGFGLKYASGFGDTHLGRRDRPAN